MMQDRARRSWQGLVVGESGAASHREYKGRLAIRKLAEVAKRSRLAILFEDRNAGNERVACSGYGWFDGNAMMNEVHVPISLRMKPRGDCKVIGMYAP